MNEKDSLYVFPSKRTDKNITHAKRSFATALKNAGIENFRFHDLRHTAASWMVQSGVDLYSVQKILGRSSIRSTQGMLIFLLAILKMKSAKSTIFYLPQIAK